MDLSASHLLYTLTTFKDVVSRIVRPSDGSTPRLVSTPSVVYDPVSNTFGLRDEYERRFHAPKPNGRESRAPGQPASSLSSVFDPKPAALSLPGTVNTTPSSFGSSFGSGFDTRSAFGAPWGPTTPLADGLPSAFHTVIPGSHNGPDPLPASSVPASSQTQVGYGHELDSMFDFDPLFNWQMPVTPSASSATSQMPSAIALNYPAAPPPYPAAHHNYPAAPHNYAAPNYAALNHAAPNHAGPSHAGLNQLSPSQLAPGPNLYSFVDGSIQMGSHPQNIVTSGLLEDESAYANANFFPKGTPYK